MKTLKQFKEEWIGKCNNGLVATHCKCDCYDKESPKYFIAINYVKGYGYNAIHVERKDGQPLAEGEVNECAFGTTYGDFIDSFFWC